MESARGTCFLFRRLVASHRDVQVARYRGWYRLVVVLQMVAVSAVVLLEEERQRRSAALVAGPGPAGTAVAAPELHRAEVEAELTAHQDVDPELDLDLVLAA